jgi:hypothetical protein
LEYFSLADLKSIIELQFKIAICPALQGPYSGFTVKKPYNLWACATFDDGMRIWCDLIHILTGW